MIRLRRLHLGQFKGLTVVDLAFPVQGSILIEGLNEAGKSSLFDALHFALYGRPLVGDQAAALAYSATATEVAVVLEVESSRVTVHRRLRQTARTLRHEAELWIANEEDTEYVRGVRAVRDRLIAELGGLTSDVLQNSCLVAQKALGRLETLNRREREGALAVLLNLGRLREIEQELRPARQHEDEARRAGEIARLAEAAQTRAALHRNLTTAERTAALARLRDQLAALDAAAAQATVATEERDAAERDLAAARQRLEAIARCRTRRQAWQAVLDTLGRMTEVDRQRAAAQESVAATEREADKLSTAEARLRAAYRTAQLVDEIRAAEDAGLALERQHEEARDQRERWRRDTSRHRELADEITERERQRDGLVTELAAAERRAAALPAAEARHEALEKLDEAARGLAQQREQYQALQQQYDQDARRAAREPDLRAALDLWNEAGRALQAVEAEERAAADAEREAKAAQQRAEECARWQVELAQATRRLDELEPLVRAETERRRRRAERERLTAIHVQLAQWISVSQQRSARAEARRLLGDLAFQIVAVERTEGADGPGLRLRLRVAHPLFQAREIELHLGTTTTTVATERPLAESEAAALATDTPLLPGMSLPESDHLDRQWQAAAAALAERGEPVPTDVAAARQRLQALAAALAAMPAVSLDGIDEQAFQDLLGERGQLQQQVQELTNWLRERPAIEAAAQAATARQTAARNALTDSRRTATTKLTVARSQWSPAGDIAVGGEPSAARAEAEQAVAALREQLGACHSAAAAAAAAAARLSWLEAQITAGQAALAQRASALGLASSDREAITAALADARQRVQALQVVAGSLPGLRERVTERSDQLHRLRQDYDELAQRLAETSEPELAAAIAQLSAQRKQADAQLAQRWRSLTEQLGQDFECDREAAERAARERIRRAEQARAAAAVAAERLPAERKQVAELQSHRQHLWQEIEGLLASLGAAMPAETAAVGALAQQQVTAIDAEVAGLDPERAAAAERQAMERRSEANARHQQAIEAGQQLVSVAREGVAALGSDIATISEVWGVAAQIREVLPAVTEPLPATAEVEQQISGLRERLARCEQDIQRLSESLGLPADYEIPPAAEAAAAAAEARVELHSRRYAVRVLTQARQRLIQHVLPKTERNLRALLPALTAGRYHFASLDEDYRFQVWDDRKHGYVEKQLLSGGTQDQFSLALRLSFAVAALPEEVGTRPGFLFLDEPLSSFDVDRARALVELLTQGTVARFFPQVFLISHSRLFDRGLFTHYVTMEHGSVAESTLPLPEPDLTGATPSLALA